MLLFALAAATLVTATSVNPKRGLAYITPNNTNAADTDHWQSDKSGLSWYYNWVDYASPELSNIEFVPMMWGVGEDATDRVFYDSVHRLGFYGRNVSHVLGFNEPDAPASWGGSDVSPERAAEAWVANFEPLAERGVKLGLPACTGQPAGFQWLKDFLGNCSAVLSEQEGERRNCTWDFLPVHWYDNLEGLKSHIEERRAEWPDATIWVTEYAYAHQDLEATQEHFNRTIEYFENSDYIERYSYFGAFRSEASNVGPNAAFLNNDGDLTDMGSWYTGGKATGVDPQSGEGGRWQASTVAVLSVAALTVLSLWGPI